MIEVLYIHQMWLSAIGQQAHHAERQHVGIFGESTAFYTMEYYGWQHGCFLGDKKCDMQIQSFVLAGVPEE